MVRASDFISDVNGLIGDVGEIGSIFTGSLVSLDDYGSETVTWVLSTGSMLIRPINFRELSMLPEGERNTGQAFAYLSSDFRLQAGSQYKITKGAIDYDVVQVNDHFLAGSVIFQKITLNRVDTN